MKQKTEVLPHDAYNETLVANVHPSDWVNPEPSGCYNLVVIGAGTAGLIAAAGAAGLGAKVALIERHLMGGLFECRLRPLQRGDPGFPGDLRCPERWGVRRAS